MVFGVDLDDTTQQAFTASGDKVSREGEREREGRGERCVCVCVCWGGGGRQGG